MRRWKIEMKNLMTKTVNFFKENICLAAIVVGLLVLVCITGWEFSLRVARNAQSNNAINVLYERDAGDNIGGHNVLEEG